MANKSFVISYLIKARDQFTKVTNKYASQMDKIQNKNRQVSTGMERMTTKMRSMAKVGFAAVGAAAIFALKKVINVGSEYQTSIANLSAITGATGKDLDSLSNKILKMSSANVLAQKDTAEAVKLMASAKAELLKDQNALVTATNQALLLANASGESAATATLALAGGLNAFGKGADHAAKFVDILAAGAQLGASEVSDTVEAIRMSGPAAKAAGVDFLQLNVALQALAEKQIKGTQAGTAMNAMLSRLGAMEIDPKKFNIQEGIKGIDFSKLGIIGGLEKVKSLLDQTKTPFDKAKLATKLFGLEHQKSGLALLGSISMMKELTVTMGKSGTAQKQAATNLATYDKGIERLKISLNDKLIKIFALIEPAIVKVTSLVGRFINSFDSSDIEAMSLMIKGFIAVIGVAGTAIAAFARGAFAVLKPVLAILKGIGEIIGQVAAAIVSLDFSGLSVKGLKEAFSFDGKLFGMFGGDESKDKASKGVKLFGGDESKDKASKGVKAINSATAKAVNSPVKNSATAVNGKIDANINVGLAKGLEQQGSAQVTSRGARRADVGTNIGAYSL